MNYTRRNSGSKSTQARTGRIFGICGVTLVLLGGVSLLVAHFLVPAFSRPKPVIKSDASSTSLVEHGTMRCQTGDQHEAVVHYWRPRTNAVEVQFERQGNRVFVRAVPKDSAHK